MEKNNNMKKFMKVTVAAAFAVAASGAILLGANSYLNSKKGISVAKESTTIESVKETEKKNYANVKGDDAVIIEKAGSGFYRVQFTDEKVASIGDCTFKYDYKKGILIKDGSDFKELGFESDVIVTDGIIAYFNKGTDIYTFDLKTKEEKKFATVPIESIEEDDAFATVFGFTDSKIIVNGGTGWVVREAYAIDKTTKESTKIPGGYVVGVDTNNLLVQSQFVTDVSPVAYDMYSVDGDKIEKVSSVVDNGSKIVNDEGVYYIQKWDYDSVDTKLIRCDLANAEVVQVADLTKARKSKSEIEFASDITNDSCVYGGEKFGFIVVNDFE